MSEGTSTAIVVRKSVLHDMADRYGMEAGPFEATVRSTCMPPDPKTKREATREEFAAFLLVAKQYNLNPLTREIYAFTGRNGGIVPIVSVDGWINLINSHPACDGFDFEYEHGDVTAIGENGQPFTLKNELISVTCKMFRKDRSRPVVVREYLSECIRPTEPWKMKHRMLRHKTLIQGGRYAFGFAGIYDEDEGHKIIENRNREIQGEFTEVAPKTESVAVITKIEPPDPFKEEEAEAKSEPEVKTETSDFPGDKPLNGDGFDLPDFLKRENPEYSRLSGEERGWLEDLEREFKVCTTKDDLVEERRSLMDPYDGSLPQATWQLALGIFNTHLTRIANG
jgi:phage recombination protein Bet